MNPAEWLHRSAASGPSRSALFLGDRLIADCAGFSRRAAGLAAWLGGRVSNRAIVSAFTPRTTPIS